MHCIAAALIAGMSRFALVFIVCCRCTYSCNFLPLLQQLQYVSVVFLVVIAIYLNYYCDCRVAGAGTIYCNLL